MFFQCLIACLALLAASHDAGADTAALPTLEQLVADSHLVVTGQITSVQRDGEPERIITVLVHDTIKGSLPLDSNIEIDYEKPTTGDIHFGRLMDTGREFIFFIRGSRKEHSSFRLTDTMYGVRQNDRKLIAKITELVSLKKKRVD